MKTSVGVLLISALTVAGCGTVRDSRLNPFNWFGPARTVAVDAAPSQAAAGRNALIPERNRAGSIFRRNREEGVYAGRPMAVIDEMLIERRPGGAIVRATGIADRAGPFDVRLVPDEAAPAGVLRYTLSAYQRPGPRNVGPDARKATAAVWLTDNDLATISRIEVAGRENAIARSR
ncbi:hypothetical protein ATO8_00110 [Roseivivax marinus]|jgi:hypothetical protein|uniref:Lipoprotein n=1 Tax=Roseivivax marinus TaxID=1379903 RepID=W4HQI1_9RHOB|nr:hypothetical protein [Roseivivax marinus]ETW14265.1 hypothetical protein ATO8_00110 [Roseivivax marinus]UMA66498.1 hypothetical protein LVO79_08670 [Roseivivax marinus]